MHIGLIGGIGPAATVFYYEQIVAAFARADRPLQLTIGHTSALELSRNVSAGRADVQAREFNRIAGQLAAAGADVVVSPFDIGARRMAHAILRPNVIRFLEYAFADEDTDIHIEEIPVSESSKFVGVKLMESGIRQDYNLMILSIIKADGEMVFNPAAETRIKSEQRVIACGTIDDLHRLEKALNP